MDRDPPTPDEQTPQEVAAWPAVRHRKSTLILVDGDGRFSGLAPPDRFLDVLLREHERDVARLGSFLASAEPAWHSATESVGRRLAHRLPWLLVGLAGALAAAGLMSGFEDRLRTHVILALFIPGVVYLADAVGTQTEALIIRGSSIGVRIRDVAGRELVTGSWPASSSVPSSSRSACSSGSQRAPQGAAPCSSPVRTRRPGR
jgi:magnesium transporter